MISKAEYLEKKKVKVEAPRERVKCFDCFRPKDLCLCSYITPFNHDIKFVILIHPMEAKREKMGTGRMTRACLKNSELILGVDFSEDNIVNEYINDKKYNTYLLYPGENSLNISNASDIELKSIKSKNKETVVFVIDGTWPCAKKMMRESINLHNLRRISFTPSKESLFEIKHQPNKFCLSTIESVHLLIEEWNRAFDQKSNDQDCMIGVFKEMIKFQKKCASDPNLQGYRKTGSFKAREERLREKGNPRSFFYID